MNQIFRLNVSYFILSVDVFFFFSHGTALLDASEIPTNHLGSISKPCFLVGFLPYIKLVIAGFLNHRRLGRTAWPPGKKWMRTASAPLLSGVVGFIGPEKDPANKNPTS